jgi:H+/Cl- antiporter ClcA
LREIKYGKFWWLRHSQKLRRRSMFLGGGILTGLSAYAFAVLADDVQGLFKSLVGARPALPWVITPLGFAFSAWVAQRYFPNSQGSGIPQCIAAMQINERKIRDRLLSLRLAFGKIILTVLGLACGASIGREGPTVQIGASIMSAMGSKSGKEQRALILAGSAAGIAAAFNAPLAGIVFTIEELSRSFEAKTSGLILTATIIAGLTATTLGGNYAYFGYASGNLGSISDWIALTVTAVLGGLLGGLFSRFMVEFAQRSRWQDLVGRTRHPIWFAFGCGGLVALCGLLSGGTIFGTGYLEASSVIHGNEPLPLLFVPLKMIATIVSSICGIPGGLFSPSLSVGAGVGSLVAQLLDVSSAPQFALLGMAAYLTGVVQSPITSVVIMAEMTDNHAMVVPLMICALIANTISKRISPVSLYHSLSLAYLPAPASAARQANEKPVTP